MVEFNDQFMKPNPLMKNVDYGSTFSPYTQFKNENSLGIDPQAASSASSFLSTYKAGQPVQGVSVGKVAKLPTEYYQQQIQDLSQPITAQYERARSMSRGDQAARGTLYDSEGYQDIGNLDKSFLEQLGSMTRGVQLERMKADQANEQNYLDRLLSEGNAKRSADLQAKGLDVNMINSLLGYGADRYKSEAGLFSDIYGADTEFNKALLDKDSQRVKDITGLLDLKGYQGVPQEQLFEGLLGEIGYDIEGLKKSKEEGLGSQKAKDAYNNGQQWYVPNKGWTKDGSTFQSGSYPNVPFAK